MLYDKIHININTQKLEKYIMPRFGRILRGPRRIIRGPFIRPFVRPFIRPHRFFRRILFGSFIYLAIAGNRPYKLYPEEVERIEQDTGKSAEDLSEEELRTSMNNLNIEHREVSDAEFAKIDEMNGKSTSDSKTGAFCSFCGAKLASLNAKFCSNCGSKV